MNKPIIIWEPNPSGHRLSYVRYLAQWLKENGHTFLLATTEYATSSSQWDKQGLVDYPHLTAKDLSDLSKHLPQGFQEANLVIPDSDNKLIELIKARSVLKHHKLTLLIMRPSAIAGRFGKAKHLLKMFVLGLLKSLYRNTRIFALSSPGMHLPLALKVLGADELQDPCEWAPGLTRAQLGLPDKYDQANVYLVAGELSNRKYLPEILGAWIAGIDEQNVLVLAGTLSQNLDEQLISNARNVNNIHFVEGYIGNTEFDSWIDQANYVFVLHKNAGSSGVAIKAAFGGTTIITGGDKSIKQIVQQMTTNFEVCEPVSIKGIQTIVEMTTSRNYSTTKSGSSLISPSQWSETLVKAQR